MADLNVYVLSVWNIVQLLQQIVHVEVGIVFMTDHFVRINSTLGQCQQWSYR